jgi:cytidylate kinase
MVIAIDGPAGAGKSTVARAVAAALGWCYLDTGAMYRCVALASLGSAAPVAELAAGAQIELGERVLLNGVDVTEAIRTPEVSARASQVAADPDVRRALTGAQRRLLAHGDWVAEGRDIGTVVAPQAQVKVYLDAGEAERARRRAAELGLDAAVVLADQRLRDTRDQAREQAPLRPAPDAVVIDTSGLTAEQVAGRIVALAAGR